MAKRLKAFLSELRKEWNPDLHPRGKDGRFIEKFEIDEAKDSIVKMAELFARVREEDKTALSVALLNAGATKLNLDTAYSISWDVDGEVLSSARVEWISRAADSIQFEEVEPSSVEADDFWYSGDEIPDKRGVWFGADRSIYTFDVNQRTFKVHANQQIDEMDIAFVDDADSIEATGRGDSAAVFANVMPAVVAIIRNRKPRTIGFSASGGSRARLYERMARTAARVLGYSAVANKTNSGDVIFRLVSPDMLESGLAKFGGTQTTVISKSYQSDGMLGLAPATDEEIAHWLDESSWGSGVFTFEELRNLFASSVKEMVKEFREWQHPRGDDGRFIEKSEIEQASVSVSKAADLFRRVTDEANRAMLVAALREAKMRPWDLQNAINLAASTEGRPPINPKVLEWAQTKWGDATAPDGSSVAENFAKWFGWSKVVDKEGNPMVVYHGTNTSVKFNEFEPTEIADKFFWNGQELPVASFYDVVDGVDDKNAFIDHVFTDIEALGSAEAAYKFRTRESDGDVSKLTGTDARKVNDLKRLMEMGVDKVERRKVEVPSGHGSYFTPHEHYSFIANQTRDDGRVYPVYLKIENPKFVHHGEVEGSGNEFKVKKYKEEGYDGVIAADDTKDIGVSGWSGATQIVAFDPTQIKSAIGNDGMFGSSEKDIRKTFAVGLRSLIKEFREWEHPRGEDGRFIDKLDIQAAIASGDVREIAKLFARIAEGDTTNQVRLSAALLHYGAKGDQLKVARSLQVPSTWKRKTKRKMKRHRKNSC